MAFTLIAERTQGGVAVKPFDTSTVRSVPAPQQVPEVPDALPSWDEIVRTHSARVYRLAYRLTGNKHDAEDLTQEVFVRVFRSLSSYTPGTFEGWLYRITTNLFLDGARRKQRIRFDGLPEDALALGRQPVVGVLGAAGSAAAVASLLGTAFVVGDPARSEQPPTLQPPVASFSSDHASTSSGAPFADPVALLNSYNGAGYAGLNPTLRPVALTGR